MNQEAKRVQESMVFDLFQHVATHPDCIASVSDPECELEYLGFAWCGEPAPDYIAQIKILTEDVVHWIQDDQDLLGTDYGNDTNTAAGKTAYLHLLNVDTVTINTFIPQNNVEDPFFALNGKLFSGDDRSSGSPPRAVWNENGSYRTQQKLKIIANQEFDSNGLVDDAFGPNADGNGRSDRFVDIGTTRSFEASSSLDASGNLTAAALADTTPGAPMMLETATASKTDVTVEDIEYLSPKVLKLVCKLDSPNPLVSGAPAINYTLELIINRDSNTFTLEGSHDGFPAYEVYINGARVYEHDPLATGEGLGSLFPPEEHDVSVTGSL